MTTADAVLRYADRPTATIDVFLPDGPARGVVLLLHGGFWRQVYDVTGTLPLGAALAREGYVAALPEYRRVPGPGDDLGDEAGGWPTTCEDVEAAYDALPALLATLGVESGPAHLVGHSAGGHLALWLAGRGKPAAGVVALAPVADLVDAVATRMGAGAAIDFLGGTDVPRDADPAQLLEARPTYPVTVLHGTADAPVPLANAQGLVARHPWIDLRELDGIDHMSLIDPDAPPYADLLAALADQQDPTVV
ncbi:putative lipase/esterase [Marmoricola endophyticus]|uniref:Lipase/esterase n=1 Tax=Marmoricola endophyticus TaxID=2040280 RepID=A0A917BLN8_9ACTN|nr:alpha/beta hydrolase [Marmoricola endophyticus]GGF49362.1 putative lipase/esterase [Marmoricola endophyticus]